MGKVSFDFLTIKAAGVYTQEIDNSTRTSIQTNAFRLIPGFSNKGPFNRPVWLEKDADRISIFGDIDTKLEHKGCFFNRMIRTMLSEGPVIALNLLKTDDSFYGPDQVNYAALSLDAAKPNPRVGTSAKYGQYDYSAEGIDKELYNTKSGDMVPFIGNAPFSAMFNRSRFWIADKEMLTGVAARGLNSPDYSSGSGSYEYTNFLNFANVGTEEFSILVMKPENLLGYDITAESWYGGVENIPFGWIRPSDYISDYFLQVVCIKGNWSNYPVLSTDPVWKSYFNKNGIIRSKINNFMNAEGVVMLGSWTGCIIPDFTNRQGDNLSLELKVNARTEVTGLLMSFNEDAAHVVTGDYTGIGMSENDDDFDNTATKFEWGIDIDGNHEVEPEQGEGKASYIVDMVGHGIFNEDEEAASIFKDYEFMHNSYKAGQIHVDGKDDIHTIITNEVAKSIFNNVEDDLVLLQTDGANYKVKLLVKGEAAAEGEEPTVTTYPDALGGEHDAQCYYASGVYIPVNFFNLDKFKAGTALSASLVRNNILDGSKYYVLTPEGELIEGTAKSLEPKLIAVDVVPGENGELEKITNINLLDNTPKKVTNVDASTGVETVTTEYPWFTAVIRFEIRNVTYIAYFKYQLNDKKKLTTFEPGMTFDLNGTTSMLLNVDDMTAEEVEKYAEGIQEDENGDSGIITKNDDAPDSVIPELEFITRPVDTGGANYDDVHVAGKVGFLSYVFSEDKDELDPDKKPVLQITDAYYFNDPDLWADGNTPVSEVTKNMFIVTDDDQWDYIKVGSLVRNIAFKNENGIANTYKVIPGVTRVIEKRFVPVTATGEAAYRGKVYQMDGTISPDELGVSRQGVHGFYLYTTIDPVLIEVTPNEDESGEVSSIIRQLPLSDEAISGTMRFIPLKGLKLTSRHRPGYDAEGNISIEGGIEKIYSVLNDEGVHRGLCNPAMVDYRYIVDCMSYGLETGLGGKAHLSALAQDRGSTLAVLNMPSAKQFAVSSNPYFCDSYTPGAETRPSFNVKYVAEGGNHEMGSSRIFNLPDEDAGSKYAAAFFPNLIYSEGGRKISVPPAADVCNVLVSKFTGINNPYAINANMNGLIRNRYVVDLEFAADTDDRGYLEPMGVNTIIKENGRIMIYGNQTCYQTTKSDMNKLHVRECLNTIEIECNATLKQFNFQYNTEATRASIVQALTPILSVMQNSGAIDAFVITCDESNNTPEIIEEDFGIVDIGVWFNHGMEKIVTRITVNRYGTQNSGE